MDACLREDLDLVRLLVASGANRNAQNQHAQVPHLHPLRLHLQASLSCGRAQTPLFLAARQGRPDVVQLLLANSDQPTPHAFASADVNALDEDGTV